MSSDSEVPPNNGAVLTIAQIIKAVMSSAAEAKVGALFINCGKAIPAWHTLEFMGHPQPPLPIQTDNTTALGIVNQNVMEKLKSMDMKYHWLRCRISQEQFRHYWAAGKTNLGDYVTKHHPAIHHQSTRGLFLTDILKLMETLHKQTSDSLTAVSNTSRSKGVLDTLGQANSTSDYKKSFEAQKLCSRAQFYARPFARPEPVRKKALFVVCS